MLPDLIVAQAPPTPTPFPAATPLVDMPEFGLWGATDPILQFWNGSGIANGAQLLIIVILVVAGIFVLIHFVRQLSGTDDH